MNSQLMMNNLFRMDEDAQDLWDLSSSSTAAAEFLTWPMLTEHRAECDTAMTWANDDHALVSNGNSLDENAVLFGGYSTLPEEEDEGVVLVDSCASSSRVENDANDGEEENENDLKDHFDDFEDQVHFFETATIIPVPEQTPTTLFPLRKHNEKTNDAVEEEDEENETKINLSIKIENGDYLEVLEVVNESVVSTPDVVDEIITLEGDETFKTRYFADNLQEFELVQKIEDGEEVGMELLAEYVGINSCHNDKSSDENTEFEDDARDEDYKPPKDLRRSNRSTTNSGRSSVSSMMEGKKRGRPAKPIRTALSARELANLPPELKRFKESRFKNNEASRKSRFKRRQKELKLSQQLDFYADENSELRRALKKHKILHNKLRTMIINIKIAQ